MRVNFMDLKSNYKTNNKDAKYDMDSLLWHCRCAFI